MRISPATMGAFFDEMEKIAGWQKTLVNALADASVPLGSAALGAGIGAVGAGEGNRLSGARKGALIGGGIGTGFLLGGRGLDALEKAFLKQRLTRVSTQPKIPELVNKALFLGSGAAGGVAGHKLNKKFEQKE